MEQIIQIDLNSDAFDYARTFQIKSVINCDKLQYNTAHTNHLNILEINSHLVLNI
mgnify:CR=1 FL=1